MKGLGAVLLGLLLCTALAAPALATAGSIAGTVTTAAIPHEPIEWVWVCASGHPFPPGGCDSTDAEGKYRIDGLEAGGYTVSFEDATENYIAQKRGVGVLPGQEVAGIDAELQVGGRITGRVTDVESGVPIEYVEVCAPQVDSTEEIRTIYCDRTDSEGNYTVQALAAGLYKIEFGTYPASLHQVNYIRQYYPGKSSWAEAEVFPVTAGTTLSGKNAAMQRGVEISGTVTDSGGAPVVWESRVCALDASSETIAQCAPPEQDGLYRIAGLPFGSYKVSFGVDVEEEPGLVLRPDGFVPQYYNAKATFGEADTLGASGPAVFSGIDARLVRGDDPARPRPTTIVPPTIWSPIAVSPRKPPFRCRKGKVKRRVKGKLRCVKRHKKRHHAAGARR